MASPSAGAPALKYGDVNTEINSPGEVKGLIDILKVITTFRLLCLNKKAKQMNQEILITLDLL